MKVVRQFFVILAVSFAGELLHALIPLPVPAGIYGLAVLFALLALKVIKAEHVGVCAEFFIGILPLLLIPAAAGIMAVWEDMAAMFAPIILAVTAVTVLVFAVTGKCAQMLLKSEGGRDDATDR